MSVSAPLRSALSQPNSVGLGLPWLFGCLGLALLLLMVRSTSPVVAAAIFILLSGGIIAALTSAYSALQAAHRIQLHRLMTAMAAEQLARSEAEMAVRDKSRLLATVAHEIRTPLNGVIGMVGLLLETPLSPEQRNYAGTANNSGRTLLSIVDEILDTAKAQATQSQANGKIEIASLLENVTELLAPRAHAKNIDISCFVSPDVPREISGDDLRLRQILFNLAGNAIKFTTSGGVALEASIDQTKHLVIDVIDTGIGLTEDEAAKVFREFTQANAQTQRRYGGTGLGLSISAKLVEAMGGKIDLTSTPSLGSKFSIRLPIAAHDGKIENIHSLAGKRFYLALKSGLVAEHLARSLGGFGAEITWLNSAHSLSTLVSKAADNETIIADPSYAKNLLGRSKRAPKQIHLRKVWVLLRAEERREHRQLLGSPFAGYLLSPLRRSTLLSQLVGQALHDETATISRAASQSLGAAKLKVLLAEDNPVNALLASTFLKRLGHRVVHVGDGEAALATLKKDHDFDLCLLDVEMPRRDGLSTARAVRDFEKLLQSKRIPLLALTANAREEDIAACLLAGMDGHLSKPFDQLDLDEKIQALIPRAKI